MVKGAAGWLDVLWPIVLLALLAGAFRRTVEPRASTSHVDCQARAEDVMTLERCIAADPRDVDLLMMAGDAYARQGDADRAAALYRRALAVDPREGDLHLRLGTLLLERGDRAAARVEAAAALDTRPGSAAALRLLEHAAGARAGR